MFSTCVRNATVIGGRAASLREFEGRFMALRTFGPNWVAPRRPSLAGRRLCLAAPPRRILSTPAEARALAPLSSRHAPRLCRASSPTPSPRRAGRRRSSDPAFSAIVVDANTGRDALCRQRERPAPSRLDHQGDDALSAVRAARQGRADAADADPDLRARRRAGALQARALRRRHRSASTTRSRPS